MYGGGRTERGVLVGVVVKGGTTGGVMTSVWRYN